MFDTGYRMLGAGAQGWSREMTWGGKWEGGSGLGTHVHLWRIHVNVWQNSIVKNKQTNKQKKNTYAAINLKKKKKNETDRAHKKKMNKKVKTFPNFEDPK